MRMRGRDPSRRPSSWRSAFDRTVQHGSRLQSGAQQQTVDAVDARALEPEPIISASGQQGTEELFWLFPRCRGCLETTRVCAGGGAQDGPLEIPGKDQL